MIRSIISYRDAATPMHANQIGGKALNLLRMSREGFDVPPFFVVTADIYREHVLKLPAVFELLGQISAVPASELGSILNQIQSAIKDGGFPASLRNQVRDELEHSMGIEQLVAVRSSASDEDGADHSFAGMHDSFLFVQGLEQVLQCISQVWASAFNGRAIAYRVERGLDISKISVAVVVQQMIDAHSSGVIFTCDPANDRTDQLVVSSVFGAGEGLVSGGLAADTFAVDKQTKNFESTVVEKHSQLVLDVTNQSGLIETDVQASLMNAPSLSDEQVRQAADVAVRIENFYRRPQDIEFCIDRSDKLFVLQTRPITRVQQYGPAAGNRLVWDNSNIIESYSGVTSPMTFSFIRRAYTIVYHCFAEVMGISPAKVKASRHVFENMLGLIQGHVFYNLQNWYRLIRLFPGFQYNAQFMESMMGLREPLVLDDPEQKIGFWRKWFVELPALLRLILRTTWNFIRIKPIVNQFQTSFHEHYDRWDAMEFDQLAPHELRQLYHEMEDALLWNWKAPIINDFYVMIFYGLLKRYCQRWAGDETGALQNDLICGEGGVESAEPAKMLLRLAAVAAGDEQLRAVIFKDPLEDVPEAVKSNSQFDEFSQMMQQYLDLYGFRCMNELKLEEFSLRDRPHTVYQVLRNYMALEDQSVLDVDLMHQREQRIRREAEVKAFSSMRGFSLLPRKMIFRRILRNARMGVKNRENMRFARTRIYGLLREMLRAMGKQLADEKILADREDIFYLTIDEVWDYVKGTAVTTSLCELADLRRQEFDAYRGMESPDDRFESFGFVYHKNPFRDSNRQPVELEEGQLQGIGCCPGEVTKSVRVLKTPQDNMSLSGEILVAQRTDPGWVPLYPAVSGILIERGSILSHSAVVAREMGIPTIVGIHGLLAHVHDGDTVKMNGASGIVEIIET